MWRQPDVERSKLGAAICILVLDDVAWNGADTALAGRGIVAAGTAATRRTFIIYSNDFLAHDRHRVVQQRHIFRDFISRPRAAGREGLTDGIVGTTAGVSNGLECGAPHGFGRGVQHGRGVLANNRQRRDRRGNEHDE